LKDQRGLMVNESLLPEKQANGSVGTVHGDSNGCFISLIIPCE